MDQLLIEWYLDNKRDFPWRYTNDPYKIWISEIMLQQTQTTTVIDYYNRWMKDYPDINSLVNATVDDIYKHWEGLGYYSRARNIYESALVIHEKYHDIFPNHYEDIIELKGIGPYTAGAILSLSYDLPYPAVDGNVLRVFSRLNNSDANIAENKTIKLITDQVSNLLKKTKPSLFNQALFDLGATICTPTNPKCDHCPIAKKCKSYKHHTQNILPVNMKKIKKSEQSFITGIIKYKNEYMLVKNDKGLLENLYGCIQYEVESPYSFIERFKEEYNQDIEVIEYLGKVTHVFTHRKWYMHVYLFEIFESNSHLYENTDTITISTAHKKVLKLEK